MFLSQRARADRDNAPVRADTRRVSALVLVGSVVWLAVFGMGSRASACQPTDPTCVVDEVKATAQETAHDAQEKANEIVEEARETAEDTLNNVEERLEEVANPTNPTPQSPPTKPTVPGNEGSPKGPDNDPGNRPNDKAPNNPPNVKSEHEDRTSGPRRALGPLLPPITLAVGPLVRDPFGFNDVDRPADPSLGKSAIEAAKDFAFPLVLTIIVGAFLAIQHRVDRREPKLVFAPIDNDLLSFECFA